MRLILDTNVWVSGLLWHGPAHQILRGVEAGALHVYMTSSMVEELAEVLAYPKLQSRLQQLSLSSVDLVAYVIYQASMIETEPGPAIIEADSHDDVFLWCADAVNADCVVSGDRHLLDLGTWKGIPILTPGAFVAQHPL